MHHESPTLTDTADRPDTSDRTATARTSTSAPGRTDTPQQPALGPSERATRRRRRRVIVGAAIVALLALITAVWLLPSRRGTDDPAPPAASEASLQAWERMDLERGVVAILGRDGSWDGNGAGTGIVLSADGVVLTTNHVILGALSITVVDPASGRTYAAEVLGTDRSHDLALLQLRDATGLSTVKISTTADVRPGDDVIAVSSAGRASSLVRAPGKVIATDGTVTFVRPEPVSEVRLQGLLVTSVEQRQGWESGGPLLNAAGEVIGISTAIRDLGAPLTGWPSSAIPIDAALESVSLMRAEVASDRITVGTPTTLGVQTLDTTDGPRVVFVAPDGPAATLGIEESDIIVSIDGEPMQTSAALAETVLAHAAGDVVSISWRTAGGELRTGTATLIPGPAD